MGGGGDDSGQERLLSREISGSLAPAERQPGIDKEDEERAYAN